MSNDGWLTRKRKRQPVSTKTNDDDTLAPGLDSTSTPRVNSSSGSASKNDDTDTVVMPASLLPFLGWTKLSACHVRPRAKKIRSNWNRDEGLQKVTGRAVFFIHDPHPSDGSTDGDSKDESKIWFQGRFFPSLGTAAAAASASATNNNARHDRDSPTSVFNANALSSNDVTTNTNANATNTNMIMNATTNSWGLLATQNTIIDECLTCSEGGYRELDLTFIRQKPVTKPRTFYRMVGTSRSNNNNNNSNDNDNSNVNDAMEKKKKKKKKVRWVANDVIWTGGNMMTLSSDPVFSANNLYNNAGISMNMKEPGVKFDPQTLMEGKKAMAVAEKYFPSMVKRLRIHNALVHTNNDFFDGEDNSEEKIGTTGAAGVICGEDNDAMVLIGDMEVVAPMSFVRMGNNNGKVRFASSSGRNDDDDDDSDEDGLWND